MVYKNIKYDPTTTTIEQLIEEMFSLPPLTSGAGSPEWTEAKSDALQTAIHAKIWKEQFNTITETRKEFIDNASSLVVSIDLFRKSAERSSRVLNFLTFAIAFSALVQLAILIYGIICHR